ncbi:hypothetical protein Pla108_35270 [Botrimarina colliarenosi]|uniref:Uncharacterized protein n=1 Tax=Botrimarina colliarenosi TaxID=2528001 RepID=A0A5C6A793_9BACT|nr:hypothetical protein [Botrimarina colliarenosi]TWT95379.1 hypothetical protein Pla108_35270 [Botrimarina colliarenosi]
MSPRGPIAEGREHYAPADRSAAIDVHAVLARRRQIAIVWSVEDVLYVRSDLSDDQAWEVLEHVRDCQDAVYGVCWETLQAAAEALYPEPGAAL